MRASFLMLLTVHSVLIYGQSETLIDSLQQRLRGESDVAQKIDLLITLAELQEDFDPHATDSLYVEALASAQQNDLPLKAVLALCGLAELRAYANDFDEADSLYAEAKTFLQNGKGSADWLEVEGELYKQIARSFFFRYQGDSSLYYWLKAERAFRESGNDRGLSSALNALGLIYAEFNGDFDKSLALWEETVELNYKIGDTLLVARVYQNIAQIFQLKNEIEKSNQYLREANAICKAKGDLRSLGIGLNSLANNFVLVKQLDSAIYYFRASIAINKEIQDNNGLGEDYMALAKVFAQLGRHSDAIRTAKSGIAVSENIKIMSDGMGVIATAYETTGRPHLALRTYKEQTVLKDSIYNLESQRNISELQTQYETEKKEQEIELLENEKQLAAIQLSKIENQRLFLGGASFLFLIIGALLFFQYRQRNRYAQVVEHKNAQLSETMASKEKLFSIIAHDLKSPLSAFTSISGTLAENFDQLSKEQILSFLRKFEKSSQNLSELLNNLLEWSLSQTGALRVNPEELDIKVSINKAIKPLYDFAESKGVQLIFNGKNHLTMADAKMVETVIRNLVSNALKFTESGGEVRVSTAVSGEKLLVAVSDTGIGMEFKEAKKLFDLKHDPSKIGDHEAKGTGLGLILSKELVQKNKGEIWVESKKGEGSTFTFSLPLAA